MSLGTLHTHIRRIRQGHPGLYAAICQVRLAQLAERHDMALETAQEHSLAYFRKRARWMRKMGL